MRLESNNFLKLNQLHVVKKFKIYYFLKILPINLYLKICLSIFYKIKNMLV